jgi:hypothetical protein
LLAIWEAEKYPINNAQNGLEDQVTEVGWALMRQLIVEQWRLTDQALVRAYQEQHCGTWVTADGYDELQVVGRFGVIQLRRQVCYNSEAGCHELELTETLRFPLLQVLIYRYSVAREILSVLQISSTVLFLSL